MTNRWNLSILENVMTIRCKASGVHAWLVGADIGCLAAAVHLIQDAKYSIRTTESATEERRGQFFPGRILSRYYVCTNDLLSRIPSLSDSMRSIQDELVELENDKGLSKDYHTRVVVNQNHAIDVLNVKPLGLNLSDRARIKMMMLASKRTLMKTRIMDIFNEDFFHGKFWSMCATKHLRYIHNFADLHTLSPIDCTPYELFNNIIVPITSYLQTQGVEFKHNVKVLDVVMDSECDPTLASGLKVQLSGAETVITIRPKDILVVTLGSIFAGSTLGTNRSPPSPAPEVGRLTLDDSWDLWFKLSRKYPKFGDPSTFCTRIAELTIECFLVTLNDWDFFERFASPVHTPSNTETLVSFKDSNWRLSLNVPRQPHLAGQPENTQLIWGYALSPSREGNFIRKPMSSCTGQEALMEVLQQLHFPLEPALEHSVTVTSLMPLATAQYLTRDEDDRPKVIPDNVQNMALIGQFVEIPDDTVFSMEYSIRGAQTAVYHLMGLERQPEAHKHYWDSFWTILV
ncbi:Myosin-cross-reactive antigen family protein [Penicillium ucsense]|uniref:Myosin-cross-reactive antigen family protein n=1 Tax=Penicillium ucsense TaxID=2839758 RepID=A0A8J8VVM2_9EURO|nr:Myosin-cross-reactive antigen family protein [Penicillium ucsense]KAF7726795.1 Myosin-cross-reactive antigen family protein [Penicillium ucsense]